MKRSIFSKAFPILLLASVAGQGCSAIDDPPDELGAVAGTIRFFGAIPKSTVRDEAGQRRDLFFVDRESKGLRFVVVYLESVDSPSAADASSAGTTPNEAVVVNQLDLAFRPRVIAIRSGQRVLFTNDDPDNHNVRSTAQDSRNHLNIVTAPDREFEKRFVAEEAGGPIRLSCDVHAWMRGWIYVFEHPYFAVTGLAGEYRIDGVAPGAYRVVVEQPDGGLRMERQIAVGVGPNEPTLLEVDFSDRDLTLD